jgi:hypothetical protein
MVASGTLDRCPDAVLRNSRAHAVTDTFLSVGKGELASVTLEGNALSQARKPTQEENFSASWLETSETFAP